MVHLQALALILRPAQILLCERALVSLMHSTGMCSRAPAGKTSKNFTGFAHHHFQFAMAFHITCTTASVDRTKLRRSKRSVIDILLPPPLLPVHSNAQQQHDANARLCPPLMPCENLWRAAVPVQLP